MIKKKFQTLKGFRDFLPQEAKKRQWLKDKMVTVFESWGYQPIETPTLEYLELFQGQIGEDEKLFYQFKDLGGRQVAMRYDQTVPTCRFIGNHFNDLTFPFRRYQIQSVFRADKPQKGRYREFLHSDLDIFGVFSPAADAEIISVSLDLYQKMGFKNVVAKINNRDLMKDIPYPVLASVDKLGKIGEGEVLEEIRAKGIGEKEAKEYLRKIKNLKPDQTLKMIFNYLRAAGFADRHYQFQPTLARAFSYSQGPIWEFVIPQYEYGSVGGGERYDRLLQKISGQNIGGTGVGIGFERTLEAAEKMGLIPDLNKTVKVLLTVFNKQLLSSSLEMAKRIREKGISAEVYPQPDEKLATQLNYANKKGILWAVIIGPDEMKQNKAALKNMKTGRQKILLLEEVPKFIGNSRL